MATTMLFPLGYINTNTGVHTDSSNTNVNDSQSEPIFSSLPIQPIGRHEHFQRLIRTGWLNLLKPNATTRGWLTVFGMGMMSQEELGQSVAHLIVA